MQYVLVFLEGVITFISPCMLPMLPIYISYFAAGETDKRKTIINALGFVFGFSCVFAAMGAFSGSIGRLLIRHAGAVNLITGFIVIILGLNFLGVIKIDFLNKTRIGGLNTKKLSFLSSIVFGIVFAVGWTPCVGAFLGSALMLASASGSTIQGILMLLTFSMGLGLPFIASAFLIDRLKGTFDFIKKNYAVINIISGGFLVVIGIMMATGLMGYFLRAAL